MSDEVYWSLGIQLSRIDRYWQILSILTRCAAITDTGFITKLALFIGVCYLFSQIEWAETSSAKALLARFTRQVCLSTAPVSEQRFLDRFLPHWPETGRTVHE